MTHDFELPVTYRGENILFPAYLDAQRFTHRIVVDAYGQEIAFEPDEERNYRALVEPNELEKNKNVNVNLLQAIAEAIEAIVK